MVMADPLFILAPPRSFTTVVSAMLGQHPQMYGLPETYLFTCETVQEWWTVNAGSDRVDGLLRALAEVLFGGQNVATIELASAWLRQRCDQRTRDIFQALGERLCPLRLVEKTPKSSERVEYMARIMNDFPQARFIHLVRHPCGHVRSRLERRLKLLKRFTPAQPHDLVTVAEQFGADPQMLWYRCNSNILAFLATVPDEQQRRVRGEDLLADPDQHLRLLSDWLGLRSDAAAIEEMKHPERSPFARFGPRNALMGGDENFFRQPILRAPAAIMQSLEGPLPWRRDKLGLTPQVRELAQRFGYS